MVTCFYCLGKHETSQCISRATQKITSEQERSAEEIAGAIEESSYRVSAQLAEVRYDLVDSLHDTQKAIEGLQEFLNWAHSEVVWRMEKQIALLTGIRDMIKNPRATQANELYEMGIDSFRRRRLDDALKLLQEASELNPGDYRVHITLGHIYAQRSDLLKALDCFQVAVAYARAKRYRRDALLLMSRALRCLGRVGEAIEIARQASSIDAMYPPAHYELASCVAENVKGTNGQ